VTEQRFFATYSRATPADYHDGRWVPVSRAATPKWTTVTWDKTEYSPGDPVSQPQPTPTKPAWTFLFGPARFITVTVQLRITNAQPFCSTHVRLFKVDAGENRLSLDTGAFEWGILKYETTASTAHINGAWQIGEIGAGERLRAEVDYWNATDPDKLGYYILGGYVQVQYTRDA
jgi:hypothetical protein